MMERVQKARIRMATWFAAVSGAVMLVLAAVLFVLLVRERSIELDRVLALATDETIKAASIIAGQNSDATRVAAEAVAELNTADVPMYLFDGAARFLGVGTPAEPVVHAARRALAAGIFRNEFQFNSQTWRVVAQAFAVRNRRFAVVAIADESDLDRQYARLVELFGMAAAIAVLLLGASSYYFSGRAIQPIQANAEAVRRFMTDAAHELRTPVTSVRAHAEVGLQRESVDDETAATLRTILSESARLSSLVADLLTLARADAGDRTVVRGPFYLDDTVSDAIASASASARSRNISLAQVRYEQAPMTGDPRLVRQLLGVLIDNALKYTSPGGAITTDVYRVEAVVVFAVEDTGIGIPADTLPHIYERFFRGATARESTGGSGLGLSIANWIVNLHGGHITVRSTPGKGTRFEVRFPTLKSP